MAEAPDAGRTRSLGVLAARVLGPAPHTEGAAYRLIGQDGGQSVALGPEHSLFVFSDTLLAPRGESPHSGIFLANCAGLARGSTYAGALESLRYFETADGLPKLLLKARPDEHRAKIRLWPEHGILLGGRVYLFYLAVRHLDIREPWSFQLEGSGLAVVDPESGGSERVEAHSEPWLWPAGPSRMHMGVQVLAHDEHILVFATVAQAQGRRARLYRVRPQAITNARAYQVLLSSEPRWAVASSVGSAEPLDLGECGTELSVSYNAWLGGYLMTYVSPLDATLQMRVADAPWGPYTPPRRVGELARAPRSELVSLAFEHPQFAVEDGRFVVLSYCQPHFERNNWLKVRLG